MGKSDLPFGSEFSPSQIELENVLKLAKTHGGDWKAFEDAIRVAYFDTHTSTNAYNRAKLANNTKLGMIAYGIIDRDANLTEFGKTLYAARSDAKKLYTLLAKRILVDLNGTAFVQCIEDMQAAGETVDLVKIREALDQRGIHVPRGGKHPSTMRLWLEKAGVFTSGYQVNEARFHEVLGIGKAELEALSGLTTEQSMFVKTLANIGGTGPYLSSDVEKLATATYGMKSQEKSLAGRILKPLVDAGFIVLVKGTGGSWSESWHDFTYGQTRKRNNRAHSQADGRPNKSKIATATEKTTRGNY